jgi:hypothetical protein
VRRLSILTRAMLRPTIVVMLTPAGRHAPQPRQEHRPVVAYSVGAETRKIAARTRSRKLAFRNGDDVVALHDEADTANAWLEDRGDARREGATHQEARNDGNHSV